MGRSAKKYFNACTGSGQRFRDHAKVSGKMHAVPAAAASARSSSRRRRPWRDGHVFGHAAQPAAELRQLLRPQITILLLFGEQQGLEVAVDQIAAVLRAGFDRRENLAEIVCDEAGELVPHGGADVADAAAMEVGDVGGLGIAGIRRCAPLDRVVELSQLLVEPIAEPDLVFVERGLRAIECLVARHATGATRQFVEAIIDREYSRVVGVARHQSCPVRAKLRRLSISLCDKAGPALSRTVMSLSPLRRPTPLG